jgi:hypothetical protein
MSTGLLGDLRGDQVAQSEFEQVLLEHFGGAAHRQAGKVVYTSTQTGSSLKLIYNEDGMLVGAEKDSDLQENEIEILRAKVKEHLLTPGQIKIRRHVTLRHLAREWMV